MKATKTSRLGRIHRIGVALWVLLLCAGSVNAQSSHVQLVLDQNLTEGGIITPSVGVHSYYPNQEVTVTAIPQPGYRFSYWLGDVSDPGTSTTQVRLGSSKAVVAVFEEIAPSQIDDEDELEPAGGGGGGGASGLVPTAPSIFSISYNIAGGVAPRSGGISQPTVLIQTPEPTTVLLLGLGGLLAGRRKRRIHMP
ncbi:PEP-CTERM sorting domain-containing protein [Planctomycetota bacterium]